MCPDGGLCAAAVEATGQHCPEFYLSDAPVPRASAAAAQRARWLGFYADCGPGRASPLTSLAPLYYAMRQKHGGQPVTPAGGGGGDRSPPAGLKLPAWVVATGLLGMLVLAGMVVHQACTLKRTVDIHGINDPIYDPLGGRQPQVTDW